MRGKAQRGKRRRAEYRNRAAATQNDGRIKARVYAPARNRENDRRAQDKPRSERSAVARVEAVNGKARAPCGAVAAAFHRVGRDYRTLKRPAHRNGEYPRAAFQAVDKASLGAAEPDLSARRRDAAYLITEARHEAQRHRKQQRYRGAEPPEQKQQLVRGYYFVKAGKPQNDACKHR